MIINNNNNQLTINSQITINNKNHIGDNSENQKKSEYWGVCDGGVKMERSLCWILLEMWAW